MYRVLLLLCLSTAVIANDECSPRIVVIGAGPAGIAAASKLLEHGFENVRILEAEDRWGGRIYTTELNGYLVDLGAQWVHGEVGNAAFQLANPLGLLNYSTPTSMKADMYSSSGTKVDPTLVNDIHSFFFDLLNKTDTDGREDSIGDYFVEKWNEYFMDHPEINETMQNDLLWYFNLVEIAGDGSDSWYDVSSKQYSQYHTAEGDNGINWKELGYSTILDILMKKIPNPEEELPVLEKMILETEVAKIDYSSEDGPIKITTTDEREYLADHVIVTTSIGVLQADHETLFDPPLPESKVNSIKGIGFGAAAKIWMVFEDIWWQDRLDEVGIFAFLWTEEDRKEYESKPEEKWIPSIAFAYFGEYRPHALEIWISGEGARIADTIPDELLFNQTMHVLNKVLGEDFNISSPAAMLRSQWTTNKHFRGTYSFNSMKTAEMDATREALAEPVMKHDKPTILFAGEATSPHQYATVHGAIASGWREADRLIDLHSNCHKNVATENHEES